VSRVRERPRFQVLDASSLCGHRLVGAAAFSACGLESKPGTIELSDEGSIPGKRGL
jgi:hypothetical protein